MKIVKIIHSILAILPFVWFITFLLQLVIGIIHFKAIPKEYLFDDPSSMGLDKLGLFSTLCILAAVPAFFLWILMSIILLIFFRKQYSFNKPATILFFIGVAGFFIFRDGFPEVFGWVLD